MNTNAAPAVRASYSVFVSTGLEKFACHKKKGCCDAAWEIYPNSSSISSVNTVIQGYRLTALTFLTGLEQQTGVRSSHLGVIRSRSSLQTRSVPCDNGSCCPGRKIPFRTPSAGSRARCWPYPCGPSSWTPSASCAPWWCHSSVDEPCICRCSSAAEQSRRCRSRGPVRSLSAPAPSESRALASGPF